MGNVEDTIGAPEVQTIHLQGKQMRPHSSYEDSCAQGSEVGSIRSIPFRAFLTFTTIWGTCSSLDSQPKTLQQRGFGHSLGTAHHD